MPLGSFPSGKWGNIFGDDPVRRRGPTPAFAKLSRSKSPPRGRKAQREEAARLAARSRSARSKHRAERKSPSPPKPKTERELLADPKYRAAQTAAAAKAAAAAGKSLAEAVLEDILKDVPADKKEKARDQFATLLKGMPEADKADKTKLEAKARRAAKVAMKGGRRRGATRRPRGSRKGVSSRKAAAYGTRKH
jgi:hypothetical protein